MIKIKHRILTVLLSATMICSGFNAFAENAQESFVSEYIPLESEEFDALNTMGLLSDETANMSATQEITRAQFVGDLYKIAGYSKYEYTGGDIPFIDVNVDTVYKDEICYFYNAGFVKGISGSIFAPEDKITYVQAVKLIVDVLGYTEYTAKKYGLYPNGYIAMANVLELPEGIKIGDMNSPLTADKAIRLLYNAGRTNIMETSGFTSGGEITYEISGGNELLSQNNHIYYGEGIVQNNGIVSLITGERKENTAVIDSKEYIIADNIDITAFLGCRVKYFYKSESGSDETLLWAACHTRNDIITVKSEDLMPEDPAYDKTTIVYSKNNKRTTLNIDKLADVVYNNTIHNVYNVLKPKSGTMKFIDNDNDNIYDIVIVEEFKNMFVKSVPTAGNMIVGKYNQTIYLDDYTNVKIIDNGKIIGLDGLKNNRIISYIESLDNEYIYIYVNETGKTDTLTASGEKNGETVYCFSDTEYIMAESYKTLIEEGIYSVVSPQIGQSYKYYLDMSGNIADVEEADVKLQYAYLINAVTDDSPVGDKNTAIVRLLLQNGEKVTAATNKKIKLNGNKGKTGADLLSDVRLKKNDKIIRQIVRVMLNSEGKITEFEFAEDNTGNEYGYDNTRFTLDYAKETEATYYSNSINMVNLKYFVNRNTVCFAEYTDLNEEEPYGIISATGFSHGSHPVVALFDANEKLEVAAMATFKSLKGTGSDLMLVDKVKYVYRNGENCMQISGIYHGEYTTYTAYDENSVRINIKRGDVIKFGLYENKLISVSLVKRLSDTDNKAPFIYDEDGNENKYSGEGTIYGEIYSRGDNNIVTVNPDGHPNGKLTSSSFSMLMYTPVYVSVYDCRNDAVTIGEMRDFNQISTPDKDGNLTASDRNVMVLLKTEDDHIKDAIIVYY